MGIEILHLLFQGYKGVLCGACDVSYARTENGECMDCQSSWGVPFLITAVTLWGLLFLLWELATVLLSDDGNDASEGGNIVTPAPDPRLPKLASNMSELFKVEGGIQEAKDM